MNIGMLSGKGKDVPECVYEFAFPTANSYMRPGNKPLFRGSIKNHNPRKGTETVALGVINGWKLYELVNRRFTKKIEHFFTYDNQQIRK